MSSRHERRAAPFFGLAAFAGVAAAQPSLPADGTCVAQGFQSLDGVALARRNRSAAIARVGLVPQQRLQR